MFIGTATNTLTDKKGPVISIRPAYENDSMWNTKASFTDKITSTLPFGCEISVWDENGVDVSGTGPDEGLTLEIPGVMQKQNYNQKFVFSEGKYTGGNATLNFNNGDINTGTYTMNITAQDMLGNMSAASITLEVLDEREFKINHVFNFPNPVRMGNTTKIYFYHTNVSESWHSNGMDAIIKIFTLSGRLIKVFRNAENGQQWDLTDERGNRLTPNVYLYRVTVTIKGSGFSNDDKVIKSPIKKLVILPPG